MMGTEPEDGHVPLPRLRAFYVTSLSPSQLLNAFICICVSSDGEEGLSRVTVPRAQHSRVSSRRCQRCREQAKHRRPPRPCSCSA